MIRTAALTVLIALAACQPAPQHGPQRTVVLEIGAGGELRVGGQPSSLATLSSDLRRIVGPADASRLQIEMVGSEMATYSEFMQVMEVVQASGYAQRVAIVGEEIAP